MRESTVVITTNMTAAAATTVTVTAAGAIVVTRFKRYDILTNCFSTLDGIYWVMF